MRAFLVLVLALAVALHAQDSKPLATVEQLQAKVAEQTKEITKRDDAIAKLTQKLTVYQQSAFRCQDAMLDAQIDAQLKQRAPAKTEASSAAPKN